MGTITRALANNITTGGFVASSGISNTSVSAVTSLPSGCDVGDFVLISEQTASGDATINFTSSIDSTYDIYCFRYISIHPSGDGRNFEFNASTDGGSNYNVAKTSTSFVAYHNEADSATALTYEADGDEAQGTGYVHLAYNTGADNDQTCSGEMWLYNPSSTTYVKHWINVSDSYQFNDYQTNTFTAGYLNTKSAVDAISFRFSADNIDAGTIKLYGVSTS